MADTRTHEIATDVDDFRDDLPTSGRSGGVDRARLLDDDRPARPRRPCGTSWGSGRRSSRLLVHGARLRDLQRCFSLAKTVLVTVVGYAIYVTYAMVGSYLGSRTGQTHALLTRSVFGARFGHRVPVRADRATRVGRLPAGLSAQLWHGFYGWATSRRHDHHRRGDDPEQPPRVTGISVFARYLVTPILIVWCIYMVAKGFISDAGIWRLADGVAAVLVAIVAVIGFAMWGTSPTSAVRQAPFLVAPATYAFALVCSSSSP